jgi:hypothetical protein
MSLGLGGQLLEALELEEILDHSLKCNMKAGLYCGETVRWIATCPLCSRKPVFSCDLHAAEWRAYVFHLYSFEPLAMQCTECHQLLSLEQVLSGCRPV